MSFVGLIIRELSFENPIIDLKAFNNKNFALGCVYSSILGVGLFCAVYLLPLFLFSVAGYSSLQISITMIITGVFQFISAPIAGKMMGSDIDKRIILAIGFALFACGCYANSFLTAESRYWELFLPQMLRGMALMFCFMPINDIALGTVPKEEVQGASGLYNLTRNLGGAIGLALINNSIASKSKIYSQAIKETVSYNSTYNLEQISRVSEYLGLEGGSSNPISMQFLTRLVEREAFIIAINDSYIAITMLFIFGVVFIPFSANVDGKNKSTSHWE